MPHGLPLTLLIEWTFSPAYRTIAPYSARNQTCISVDTHFNSRNTSVAGLTTTIFQNSRDRRYKEAIQMLIGQFSEINCSTQRKTLPFLFHISMPNTLLRIFVQLFFLGHSQLFVTKNIQKT
ncbi:hypothetical protein VCUG_01673 [Vavraia culicis subsp. floridensis]|uniref:Uncharacterized protein n=1 Tax=Vavraia culicis (isolate floridensis) TaxID=948595 RepID=L2GT77_VAVCU|nr:uncharacterized protein VCUG_01673 [Vavraia culicis subsp. floridensis]ELA46829.1 hypothetical protein VCUG_01673 [Vavraia culicis subsp. floridensis]